MRFFLLPCFVAAALLAPLTARAQDPAPPPAPLAPCAVDRHVGLSADETEAVEQLVCTEVAAQLPAGLHRVRLVRLGSKLIVTLVSVTPDGAQTGDAQLVLSSIEEVPVAAPRLAEALATGKPAMQTQDVTNVVGEEARVKKKIPTRVQVGVGVLGIGTSANGAAANGGAHANIFVGSETFMFGVDARIGGEDSSIYLASLSTGGRYFTSKADISPFLGAGASLGGVEVKNAKGDGFGFYLEAGVDVLRSHRNGGTFAIRLDLPTFTLDGHDYGDGTAMGTSKAIYAPVVSTAFTVRF